MWRRNVSEAPSERLLGWDFFSGLESLCSVYKEKILMDGTVIVSEA